VAALYLAVNSYGLLSQYHMKLLDYFDTIWRSMGIVRKFAVALGSMLALILFVAAVGFFALELLERKAGDIVADSMRMQRLALEVDSRLQLARQAERDFALRITDLGVEGARTVYAAEFAERLGEAGRNVAWLQDMERFSVDKRDTVKSAARLEELHQAIERYSDYFRQMVEMAAMAGIENRDFERKVGELDGEYLRLTSLVRQLAISATDGARNAHEGIAKSSLFVKYILVLSVLFALALAVSIIWVLNRTVAKSVVSLRDTATEFSLGNLEARANVKGGDEFAQLAGSINSMAARITTLINDLEGQAAAASDRLMEAIDSISEGFLLYDHRERLILANRQVREIAGDNARLLKIGMTAEHLLRLNAESGVFVNALGREEEWVLDRMAQHRNPSAPMEEPLSDGRWMLIKTYRTGRGEVVVVMNDVTERKRKTLDLASINSDLEDLVRDRTKVLVEKAMELKRANERLRELDELKSAFLSSVSHELRTPLTSLLGFSKIIKRDFSRIFMPLALEEKSTRLGLRIQNNLDIIGSEGERLTRLINDVLDLSRIESGQDDWQFTEVDSAGAINRAVSAADGLFSSKHHVKLTIRRFDVVPLIHADPDRLHQVLINLLSNAAKFTEMGEVSVDLFLDARGMIRIRVEDTGRGIEARFINQIFDKFHQAQMGDTLVEKPAGTGLGLAICRQIVEHFGGRIWAESKPGRGTIMNIAMPPAEPVDRPLILVVDDDSATRDYLSMVLKKAGYGVRTASDGEQALSMAARRRPALISMDILMPGMDGRTAIERLRENENFADIPIVVVSVADDCHTAGGDATLLKPVKGDAFIGAVNALLGEEESSRPIISLKSEVVSDGRLLPSFCGDSITECSEKEMWLMLEEGFEGTVVVPESLAGILDLSRLCTLPQVQVILLPELQT